MHATFTNTGDISIPLAGTSGKDWVSPLGPGESHEVLGSGENVVIAGEKPGFLEELREGLSSVAELLASLVLFWRQHHEAKDGGAELVVGVRIHNQGTTDLRVILGNNTNDTVLVAGNTGDFTAPEYIEVRELGV